jgi:hypothetical protein
MVLAQACFTSYFRLDEPINKKRVANSLPWLPSSGMCHHKSKVTWDMYLTRKFLSFSTLGGYNMLLTYQRQYPLDYASLCG